MSKERYADVGTDAQSVADPTGLSVTDESIVLRNYDGTANTVTVRLRDSNATVAFERTYELGSGRTLSVRTRLQRGVYTVEACRWRESVPTDEPEDSAPVLVGSGPDETALVELGNGLVSVSEGIL